MRVSFVTACLLVAPLLFAGEKSANQLAREAARAERNGDLVRAYILYAEAAAKDPRNQLLWLRAETLKPIALAKTAPTPKEPPKEPPAPAAPAVDTTAATEITALDLAEDRRLLPPPTLKGDPGPKDFDLRAAPKELFERVAAAYHLRPVFDTAYESRAPVHFQLTDSDFRDTLRVLEAATASFVVPLNDHQFLVANDTPQKRQEFDRTASVVIPIPEPVSVQEVQEIIAGVRGTLDIQKLMVDSARRLIAMRDRATKVILAQKIIEDLMRPKAQVAVEIELIETDLTSSLTYGMSLPSSFALVWFGDPNSTRVTTTYPSGYSDYLSFGGGKSLLGIGITNASLFANVSKSSSTTLLRSEVVSADGQAATLHVGDRYPILTSGYFGTTSNSGTVYTPPPSINFEDLGLSLKVTPHVHGLSAVTLEVETEFKLLGGQSVDDIPVISNRKFQSQVDLLHGQWAILAGLMTDTEGRTISGLAGLSTIPLLRNNSKNRAHGETLIVLKPHLLSLPPAEAPTAAAWVGTESRPRSAM